MYWFYWYTGQKAPFNQWYTPKFAYTNPELKLPSLQRHRMAILWTWLFDTGHTQLRISCRAYSISLTRATIVQKHLAATSPRPTQPIYIIPLHARGRSRARFRRPSPYVESIVMTVLLCILLICRWCTGIELFTRCGYCLADSGRDGGANFSRTT